MIIKFNKKSCLRARFTFKLIIIFRYYPYDHHHHDHHDHHHRRRRRRHHRRYFVRGWCFRLTDGCSLEALGSWNILFSNLGWYRTHVPRILAKCSTAWATVIILLTKDFDTTLSIWIFFYVTTFIFYIYEPQIMAFGLYLCWPIFLGLLGTTFSGIWIKTVSLHENGFKCIFCKVGTVLSRLQYVNQINYLNRAITSQYILYLWYIVHC